MTTSAAAIRDTMITVIRGLTPAALSSDTFRLYREDQVAFQTWAVQNPASCFRWYSLLDTGVRAPPSVMGGNYQRDQVTFELVVGYPQNNRYGPDAGRDREDLIEQDQRQLEAAIGPFGAAAYGVDVSPLVLPGQTPRWDRVDVETVTLLVGTVAFEYWRSTP